MSDFEITRKQYRALVKNGTIIPYARFTARSGTFEIVFRGQFGRLQTPEVYLAEDAIMRAMSSGQIGKRNAYQIDRCMQAFALCVGAMSAHERMAVELAIAEIETE